MNIRSLLFSVFLVLGMMNVANAASISLSPASVDAMVGDIVALDVIMDFSDVITIGGGFDITSSSDLTFVSWAANPVGDPGFSREPDILDGLLSGIAVGDFSVGITGVQNLGTVSFEVIGGSSVVMGADTGSAAGPFVDFNTFQVIPVDYSGAAQINVLPPVPLPAAAWLFGSALFGLVAVKRKKA